MKIKNPLKGLSDKVERWLFKEEIAAARSQQIREQMPTGPNGEQLSEEELKVMLTEMVEHLKASADAAKEQFDLCSAEDHSQPPSQSDIDRYYGYHDNFTHNMKVMAEKTGMWTVSNTDSYSKEEYNQKAQSEGWSFLRNSCGLPQGKIGGTPWVTDSEGWKTEES